MQTEILRRFPKVDDPNYLSPKRKQKHLNPTNVALPSGVPTGTPTILQQSKASSFVFLPAIVNLMATYKPVGFTQAYTHQLALRRQVLVEEKNDEHLYRFQIRAAEGKSRLSPEMPIKKIFQKLQSILAHEKRHHTL